MTRYFSKSPKKQGVSIEALPQALDEVRNAQCEASLIGFSIKQINNTVKNGDFIEVVI
jgi:hypothetical protein